MLSIRLQRIGRRNDPVFRVIVTEKTRGPKSGKHVELLGSYDPRQDRIQLKPDRIKHWIGEGAEVSPTVHNLLVREKVIDGKKINVLPRKSPIIKPDPSEEPSKEVSKKANSETGSGGSEDIKEASQKTEEKPKKEEVEKKPKGDKDKEIPMSEDVEIPTAGVGESDGETTEEKSKKEETATQAEEVKE